MNKPLKKQKKSYVGRSRQVLFRRLLDYVALPASEVTAQERAMGGDILLDMLLDASDADRRLCAERLTPMREAPRRLLRFLAQCSFNIAEPLLLENEAFDACDLNAILDQISVEHRKAIAGRKTVAAAVAGKLVDIAEPEVLEILIQNPAAELSETTLDTLVARSRKEKQLCALLIRRTELRPMQAMAMFWWSDGSTRRQILQRQAAERIDMVEMCADIFALAAEEGWQDPVSRKTLQLIERRQRNRAAIDRSPFSSLEDAISTAARDNLTPEITQEIGYLSGIKPITIAKIITDPGGEALAVLCKATGLKREYLEQLWLATDRQILLTGGKRNPAFDYVAQTFEMLSVAKAQTTLRYWNWSLSSTFSPAALQKDPVGDDGSEEQSYSAARRTVRLVFGQ